LYSGVLNRLEEAVPFYRQAVDKYLEVGDLTNEGVARSNLAETLRKLNYFEEARQEIHRAIECKEEYGHAAEPWKTWEILARIESGAGNHISAGEAKRKGIGCYIAYRRDGGEAHGAAGRFCVAVGQSFGAGGPSAATSLLDQAIADSGTTGAAGTFFRALQAIVAGSRDRTLADDPEFSFIVAFEILFLIETLEKPG
jgi:hypothetical protein